MGLYEEFRFHPAPWLPHSDLPLEELERIRNIKREDMEYTNENGFSVKIVMEPTLLMVQDIFYSNKICGNGYVTGQSKFLKGRAVFHGAYAYEEATFAGLKNSGSISIDIGVAPFPYGPNNPDQKNFGDSSGFAISSGSDAPYTAGMLIDLIGKYQEEENVAKDALLQPGSKELYDKLGKNLYMPSYTDGVLEQGFGAFYLLYYVRQGDDINKVISTYETNYTKMINDANALLGKD